MAKDDYFVIAYKILKYFYTCLKSDQDPDINMYNANAFNINQSYWDYIMVNLFEYGYISDLLIIPPTLGRKRKGVRVLDSTMITPDGIKYLEENSMFQRFKQEGI